jgi:hypothetical protein
LLAVLEIAFVHDGMGDIAITGCATILTVHTDFVEYVAVIASIGD